MKINNEQKILFFNELRTLLSAGFTLAEAVDSLQSQLAASIKIGLKRGENLSALLNRENIELEIVCILRSAEHSGRLCDVFDKICRYYENKKYIKDKIFQLLLYPAVTLIFALLIVLLFFIVVFPRFQSVYQSLGLSTGFSGLGGIAGGLFLVSSLLVVIFGRKIKSKFTNNRYYRAYQQGYLFYILSVVLNTTELSSFIWQLAPNHPYKTRLYELAFHLKKGQPLSTALAKIELIDEQQRIRLNYGERAGDLAKVLGQLAEESEKQFVQSLEKLFVLIEPLVIVGVGLFIGGISLQVIMPVIKLTQNLM